MGALCTNKGGVIDEDPELRLNQRLHVLHRAGGVLLHQLLLLHPVEMEQHPQ